ncbi:ATP-binding protein [archaeon]|nr:ATP-binding protein [archaeon]
MVQKIKIFRDEANEIKKLKGWLLIYGRRKTGKTFLIKNFLSYGAYFLVRRDGKILGEKILPREINNVNDFLKIIFELIKENKTMIIIDEFQRLPEFVLEELSSLHPNGKVILSGSSMRILKKIFGSKSSLLGLVLQYKLDLIKPKNILRELVEHVNPIKAIEFGAYFRDPWTLSFFKKDKTTKIIYELLNYSKLTIPSLIGEIFTEEERELTKTYEAILRIIGSGEWDYKLLANILAARKLIDRADSSLVLPYIKNLQEMGLVESLDIFKSNKKMYKLKSAIMDAFYYLSDRYNFDEREVSFNEASPTLDKIKNLAVQNFIADFFAEHYHGKKSYSVLPNKEIDFIINVRNKTVAVGEVKWGRYDNKDLDNFLEKVKDINGKKIVVVQKKIRQKYKDLFIYDAADLIKLSKR